MPERLEVQRAVAASADEIFAVLTDPGGHVAIDSSGMLMAASGDTVAKAGDTFVVHMDREALNDYPLGLYDVTSRSSRSSRAGRSPGPCTASWTSATCTATGCSPSRRARS
jgi:hypothetical protein